MIWLVEVKRWWWPFWTETTYKTDKELAMLIAKQLNSPPEIYNP